MDVSSIPKKYGGDLDFECGMMPSMDPELRKCLDIKDARLEELFLTGPTRWVNSEEGEMIALSVGSIDGKPHKEAVATMSSLAVRTATGSSTFQSQRSHPNFSSTQLSSQPPSATQSRPQSKRAVTPQMQTPMQPPPPQLVQAAPQQQPLSYPVSTSEQMPPPPTGLQQAGPQGAAGPESQSTVQNGSVLKSQPVSFDGASELQNGGTGPPKSIVLPPAQLQRAETQYMTPATEASELKNFQ